MKRSFKVPMAASATTKGTFLYEAMRKMGAGAKNIYIQKDAPHFLNGETPPGEIEVVVNWDDGQPEQ